MPPMKRPLERSSAADEPTEAPAAAGPAHSPLLLVACVAFRCSNALCTGATVFAPDEYWQALEPAYAAVWPDAGFLPWEYQQHARIRGVAHPAVFALLYGALKAFGLDTQFVVAHGPRLFQALLAAIGDYFFHRLAHRLLGARGAKWTLFCTLMSWFLFYALTRTLSNSLECSLGLVAFYFWPDTSARGAPYDESRRRALLIAAICIVIRPTSALIWLWLGLFHFFFSLKSWSQRSCLVVRDVLPIGAVVFFLSTLLDAVFYERERLLSIAAEARSVDLITVLRNVFSRAPWHWPIVGVNFVRLNSGTELSALYGTHPWHWYLTQGLPTNLGTMAPIFVWALVAFVRDGRNAAALATPVTPTKDVSRDSARRVRRSLWLLLSVLAWSIVTYSMNAHKEFRFLLGVTPIAFLFIGRLLASLEPQSATTLASATTVHVEATTTAVASSIDTQATSHLRQRRTAPAASSKEREQAVDAANSSSARLSSSGSRALLWSVVTFLLMTNVPMAAYFTLVHQSGPARVFDTLHALADAHRHKCAARADTDEACTPLRIHFLVNCHSMPMYSYMHPVHDAHGRRIIDLQFLDCSPLFIDGRLHGNGSNPCSASSLFASEPEAFLRQFYDATNPRVAASSLLSSHPHTLFAKDGTSPWPWYRSEHLRRCFRERLGLNDTQIDGINNELPGGSVIDDARTGGQSTSLMPDVIVITPDQFLPTSSWLLHHGYTPYGATHFHSHFDATKEYMLLTQDTNVVALA